MYLVLLLVVVVGFVVVAVAVAVAVVVVVVSSWSCLLDPSYQLVRAFTTGMAVVEQKLAE